MARDSALLLLVVSLIAVLASDPFPDDGTTSVNLRAPLNSVTWCLQAPNSQADCGNATRNRRLWGNDWCSLFNQAHEGVLDPAKSLRGLVLDIALVPDEDEILWYEASGLQGAYFGGLVGDMLNKVAELGGFTYNAYVIRPPHASDMYNGSWDGWMKDWVVSAQGIKCSAP